MGVRSGRRLELLSAERPTEPLKRFGAYRLALGFPNSYEVGMSNLGFQWVYRLFNRLDDVVCERFFSEPESPAETLETQTPLSEFGLLAWSVSWEMDYINLLKSLDAAGIPRRASARDERHPLLLVGGDCARINPAPLTPFVDLFAMGDGERLVAPIADLLTRGLTRQRFLEEAAAVPGLFVPAVQGPRAEHSSLGRVTVQQARSRAEIGPDYEVPHTTLLTPNTELADKLLIEISRGCTEMCRFCWAAYAMAPIKQYPARSILATAKAGRQFTDRTGLIATAVCDHPEIETILSGLADLKFHIALSSIKIDAIRPEILAILARQGERSLSIAPEAGNERLRRFINKKVSDEMLREKVRLIFAHGFTNLKLYLQIGLPSETEEDVRDLVRLIADCREIALSEAKRTGRMATIVPSVNSFIPKPHTPYENEPLAGEEELREKTAYLVRELGKLPNVRFRGMPVSEAVWEAYLAKMDESSAEILERGADGLPVRRLLKEYAAPIESVVRPTIPLPQRPPGPWTFISKR
jgi:radical SAM superfamily enzyme YgiQ (UPF0313 family)